MTEEEEQKARCGGEKRWMGSEGEIHEEIGKHLIDVVGGISENNNKARREYRTDWCERSSRRTRSWLRKDSKIESSISEIAELPFSRLPPSKCCEIERITH